MVGVVDASSLLAIARYYLPIKDEAILLHFLEAKFRAKELLLLSTIHREASRAQKGISLSVMDFLNEKELRIDDSDLMAPAPQKFSNLLDNNFCQPSMRKRLTAEQYASQKEEYMKTGDAKLILYALNHRESEPVIITEETPQSNDGKLFKKLPVICDLLEIRHSTIAEWLSANGVTLSWSHPNL